jgi:hypothetical protein
LTLELIERQCRESFVGPTAAAALTDEEVTILNADFFSGSIRARDLREGTLPKPRVAHESLFFVFRTTGWP